MKMTLPVYVFPYFMSTTRVSYATYHNNVISYNDNIELQDAINTIKANELVITTDFMPLFKERTDNKIIDIIYLKRLYERQLKEFYDNNLENNVIKANKKYDILTALKINAVKKIDPVLINDTRLLITPHILIFPKHILDDIIKTKLDYMQLLYEQFISNVDVSYLKHFTNYLHVYNNIEKACVNKEYISTLKYPHNVIVKSIIKATNDLKDEFIPVPAYDLFSSKTGRPYTSGNINYQQLPVAYKNVTKSRWDGGKLYEFDFNGCEVRAALFAIGKYDIANYNGDIYEYFTDLLMKQNKIRFQRKYIKSFIIPMMFGASIKTLASLAKISINDARIANNVISKQFNLSVIYDNIKNDIKNKKFFCNCFGRPIYTNLETRKATLVQNYIQSTASDIYHSGYSALIDHFQKHNKKSCVIYTKHDAIATDIHPDEIKDVTIYAKTIGTTQIASIDFKINIKEF